MVAPVWIRPAVGQLFRGGISYDSYVRQIVLAGLFQKRPGDIGFLRYLSMASTLQVTSEPLDITSKTFLASCDTRKNCVVEFQGLDNFFQPLNGRSALLLERLRSITRARYLSLADAPSSVPIGICVRLGNDFGAPVLVDGRITGLRKTPTPWFVTVLKALRASVGFDARAYVVSDGTPQQLSELLAQPNVEFVRPGTAIGDLLLLSRAQVLLASGASTFAAWGAFLGQMPSATHPGQPLKWWKIEPQHGQYCGEVDGDDIDAEFMSQATVALTGGRRGEIRDS